jgi:flagellar assembly protein FliH
MIMSDASHSFAAGRRWRDQMAQDATPVRSWDAFGAQVAGGSFRNLYGAEPTAQAWNITRPGETTHVAAPDDADDPLEEAARNGFVQGFAEGERITREAMGSDDTARLVLAASLDKMASAGEGVLASLLSQAVLRLVRQIMGEVTLDEALLHTRCAAVAACMEGDEGAAALEVHPDDLMLIAAMRDDLPLTANPALPRGSVRLATAEGWVEDGPDVRYARLHALLDDMEGRP